MRKADIINKIKQLLKDESDCYYSFAYKSFVFHYDGSKYDLVSIYVEENELIVECVGYSSFRINYINADKLSYNTLNLIMKNYLADSKVFE